MGLAHQKGNKVTFSYRQLQFVRIKERNARRMEDFMHAGKIDVLFNSSPTEFRSDSVVLDVAGEPRQIANDFVWIFAGGSPQTTFCAGSGYRSGCKTPPNWQLCVEASHSGATS